MVKRTPEELAAYKAGMEAAAKIADAYARKQPGMMGRNPEEMAAADEAYSIARAIRKRKAELKLP